MTYGEYLSRVEDEFYGNGWRYGQALFNVLCDVRPDLSEQIRGTAVDPFHRDDAHLNEFHEWVVYHW